jgi:hypothetical protein
VNNEIRRIKGEEKKAAAKAKEYSKLQPLTRADELLLDVYGDTIHLNDGTHLDGSVADDKIWQRRWRDCFL